MKKLLYTLTCVFIVSILSFQRLSAQDFSVGVKAGVGLTGAPRSGDDVSDDTDYPYKIGFQGGAFVELDWGLISLQPEIFFSAQGGKFESDLENEGEIGKLTTTLNLGYLQIPVLVKFEDASGLHGFLGPQFGFLLTQGGKVEIDDVLVGILSDANGDIVESRDLKDSDLETANGDPFHKTLDVSFVFGVGYEFEFGLGIDLRYNLGLTNTLTDEFLDDDDGGELDIRQTNQAVQLSLSYTMFDSTK